MGGDEIVQLGPFGKKGDGLALDMLNRSPPLLARGGADCPHRTDAHDKSAALFAQRVKGREPFFRQGRAIVSIHKKTATHVAWVAV